MWPKKKGSVLMQPNCNKTKDGITSLFEKLTLSESISKFAAFKSLWMILFWCKYSIPLQTSIAKLSNCESFNTTWFLCRYSYKLPPGMNSTQTTSINRGWIFQNLSIISRLPCIDSLKHKRNDKKCMHTTAFSCMQKH